MTGKHIQLMDIMDHTEILTLRTAIDLVSGSCLEETMEILAQRRLALRSAANLVTQL